MSLPTRPVSGAAIESAWGDAIHDYVFTPKGCDVWSSTARATGTTALKQNLDMVHDDPGGMLDSANDRIEMPTGSEGIYLCRLWLNAVNGDAGTQSRAYLYLNGAAIANTIEDNAGGTNIAVVITTLAGLTAGDLIEVYGQRRGSGTNPDLNVKSLQIIRLADSFGA